MPYTINRTDGTQLLTLSDQTTNTTATSLTLIGRGYLNFGKEQAENFIRLLENFAKNTPPANPQIGQQWYDKGTGKMKVWDGTAWKRIMLGPDDANLLPGVVFGAGLTVTNNTVTANMLSVAGRTGAVVLGVGDIAGAAPIASPNFAGTPLAPTPDTGTNTTQIATTAFVRNQIAASSTTNVTDDRIGEGLQIIDNTIIVKSADPAQIVITNNGIKIADDYKGGVSIETVGSIKNGTWTGAPIAIAYGGTGATSAPQALTNLGAMAFNGLANSLKDVGTGVLVNSNGTAIARKIVSGTPDKLIVNNPNGDTGDITISLTGDNNTGPIPISAGGTGATSRESALAALLPTTVAGDLVYRTNAGGHTRLAGRTEPFPWYLMSGESNSEPRWTTSVNATSLQSRDLAFVLSRGNHTGENNADRLQGWTADGLRDYANFTGTPPANFTFANSNFADNGWAVFRGGLQITWGRISVPGNRLTAFNFALAFGSTCFGAHVSGGYSGADAKDNNPFVSNVSPTQVMIYSARDEVTSCYYFAYGI